MIKNKGLVVGLLLNLSALLPHAAAAAQSHKKACSVGRMLGLCADSAESGLNWRSLSLNRWRGVQAGTAKVMPNKFLKLVKLFIDDLEVAQMGNMKIKINLELK